MRILVGSVSPSTRLTAPPASGIGAIPYLRVHWWRINARTEPALALAGSVARRRGLVLIDHQPHGDAPLLLIGDAAISDGAEPHGQDPRDLHTLFDEETPHGFHATLAELIVVIARPLGVGEAAELDRSARVGL